MDTGALSDGINALLVSLAGGAIVAPVLLPENTALGVTFMSAGGSSQPTLDTSGMQKLRLQIDCRSKSSYREAAVLRTQLIAGLNGFTGPMVDGTLVDHIDYIQPIDGYENDARQYKCGFEIYVFFTFNS